MTTTALSDLNDSVGRPPPPDQAPLLVVEDLVQQFKVDRRGKWRKGIVSAVAGVNFEVRRGETLSVVGETGSGKSTLARALIRAPGPKSGRISLNGHELTGPKATSMREAGQLAQMIFQDPFSALNPKWTDEKIITEPLVTAGIPNTVDRRRTVAVILERVGLSASQFGGRYPYELSGGQAQRVAIGRALVATPDLVICDEPVTALDVSIQAQILKLLSDLKEELSLTYLLIAHDLAVVRVLSDRTVTMYLGKFCEVGKTRSIFDTPAHPYTQALLSAIPPRPGQAVEQKRIRLQGEPPSPLSPPSGCRFHTRCAFAQDICTTDEPKMRSIGDDHNVACHFPLI
jgi:oligopeptide/dipeptide ABC transporter ATP-binding protein